MGQRLGQHFLINPLVPAVMVAAIDPKPEDTVIEVGPGHGELTHALINCTRLIAVERDPILAAGLRSRFFSCKNFEIVEGDIMEELAPLVAQIPEGPYKITGNLPYYLTGHLLRIIGELNRRPERAVFMVQKEVAERIISQAPDMNRLAASVQYWAEPSILRMVKRNEFKPAPNVDSAVIVLNTRKDATRKKDASFYKALRVLFAQPRKTVLNNVKEGLKTVNRPTSEADIILQAAGIDPKLRPQDLSVAAIMRAGECF